MAFGRRGSSRVPGNIWPGFVDAMTALLLVLMFVLTIFMIVQFVLRETITGQDRELDEFSSQIAELADALGLEQQRNDQLETAADEQTRLMATLRAEGDAARAEAADFETQVAELLARNTELGGTVATLNAQVDADAEAALLAAARRAALEALVADLRGEAETRAAELSAAEEARLTDAAAAEALRRRLEGATTELTAMTLSLEAARKRAEETLTMLAAARMERDTLAANDAIQVSEADRQRALLALANESLNREQALSAESQRKLELLNQQTAQLRQQLNALQGLLDEAEARDTEAKIQVEALGSNLNTALAQVAAEQRRRAELEAAERVRLEAEAKDLERYRSEFFGRVREILAGREGVKVVGDRFVFDSEVLFDRGSAALGAEGKRQIAVVAALIRDVANEIPPEIDWILRVDGHTDKIPIGGGEFRDNWELSQARALSVVQFLIVDERIPARRLAATGFGEFQPVDPGDTPEALARNRRIELKFTER